MISQFLFFFCFLYFIHAHMFWSYSFPFFSPFFPFLFPLPTFPLQFNVLFFFLNHLILLNAVYMLIGITYGHLVRERRPSLGPPPPKKNKHTTKQPFLSQKPSVVNNFSARGEHLWAHPPTLNPPIMLGFWLPWSCEGLEQVVTITVGWYLQHSCHI